MTQEAEEQKKFAKGEILFQQGDPGGDLFFILDGEVTIFTNYQGSEIILSTMTKGEVIGTMTCLTKANRMASARALTDVQVKYVSHESLSKAIKSMPKWMNVVLKDVSMRLSIMNENFSQAKAQLRKIEGEQINALYTAGLMARIIASVATDKQKSFDDIPGLLPTEILDYIEPMMGRSRPEIEEIFEIFQNCGIIDMKIEKEKKRHYFTTKNAIALRDFSEFLEQAKRRKIKNILDAKFSGKENRVIVGLLRYVDAKDIKREANCKFTITELSANMKRVTGQDFELEALELAEKLDMLKLEGKGKSESPSVSFVPLELGHTLAHVKAYELLARQKRGK